MILFRIVGIEGASIAVVSKKYPVYAFDLDPTTEFKSRSRTDPWLSGDLGRVYKVAGAAYLSKGSFYTNP